MRRARGAAGSSQAPYATPIARDVSQSSGNGKLNFFANAALSATLSTLAPRILTLFLSNSPIESRNPRPSAVQPDVLALG